MILRRSLIVPLILTSLTIGVGFFSSTAYAQTQPSQADLQQIKDTVAGELANFPANVTQQCDGSETYASSYCSTKKQPKDGSTTWGVPYRANDQVNCRAELTLSTTEQYCIVSHTDGTTDYYDAGNVSTDYARTDASGTIIGGTKGATSNSIGGIASTCISGTGADCTKAVVTSAASGLSEIGNDLLKGVAFLILTFANFLLGIAGAMLNFVVYYTVFKFGSIIGNSPGVLVAWGILRDIANMLLLFGFIFLGVATILNTDKFPTRRAIPQLLIFAVLMNFSLFACEAVIDVTNGMSSLIYTQADPTGTQCLAGATNADGTSCSFLNYGIAGHIMQSTGLSSIWQNANATPNPAAMLGLAIFATIGAIVCFAAAIMLVVRLVTLTFLMVASPIGFAGMAIPFFQKFASDWWNRVIHQSFFAPIMFLLMFISLKIADTFTSGSGGVNGGLAGSVAGGLGSAVTNPSTDTVGVILIFMLVCGFLLASIIVAHRFGAMGAQGAIGFSKKIVLGGYGWAGRTAGGVAGRNSIGRVSNFAQKKYNASVATGSLRFLAGGAIDEAIGNTLQKGKEAKFGSNKSFKSEQEHHDARNKELKKIENLSAIGQAGDIDAMKKASGKVSDAELAESDAFKKGGKPLELLAQSLSAERFEKMMNNEKISEERKNEARNARFSDIGKAAAAAAEAAAKYESDPTNTALRDANVTAQENLGKLAKQLNNKDMGQLAQSIDHSRVFDNASFAAAISDDLFKDVKKNPNITATQSESLGTRRDERLNNTVYILDNLSTMAPEDASKLTSKALLTKDSSGSYSVLKKMNGAQLAAIDTSKIDKKDMAEIVSHIEEQILHGTDAGTEFSAQLSNPRIAGKWRPYKL